MSRFLRQLVIVRVTQELDRVVQHQVEQRIVPLEDTRGFPAAGKLDPDRFFQVLAQVQDGFLAAFFLVVATAAPGTTSPITTAVSAGATTGTGLIWEKSVKITLRNESNRCYLFVIGHDLLLR